MARVEGKVYSKQQHRDVWGGIRAAYCLVRFEEERYHVAQQFERALCGEDVTGGIRAEIPPDFGDDSLDCKGCVRAWTRIEKELRELKS